jgi:hypothetical protein
MSENRSYLQALLTRQFRLEDIKYDVYGLYYEAGLGLPKIEIRDSYDSYRLSLAKYLDRAGYDSAWGKGQEIIQSRFDYIRSRRLGEAMDHLDRDGTREFASLRSQIGIGPIGYMDGMAMRFGLGFESHFFGNSTWSSFLEKGIWSICFFENLCFICRCPIKVLRDERHRLHSESEGAIQWADGTAEYFINGVFFSEELWMGLISKSMEPRKIVEIPNQEQRAIGVRLYGYERLLNDLSTHVVDARKKNGVQYELFRVRLNDDAGRPARILKVECPSTGKKFLLRVSPSVRTVGAALAWTFPGVSPAEYEQLVIES